MGPAGRVQSYDSKVYTTLETQAGHDDHSSSSDKVFHETMQQTSSTRLFTSVISVLDSGEIGVAANFSSRTSASQNVQDQAGSASRGCVHDPRHTEFVCESK